MSDARLLTELDVAAAIIQRTNNSKSADDLPYTTQTLAMRRSKGAMQGYWEFPGGKREAGESMKACLAREIREELGVTIDVGRFLAVSTHSTESAIIHLYAFIVTSWIGDITLHDHDKMLWLNREELETVKWSPADIPFVQMIKADSKQP